MTKAEIEITIERNRQWLGATEPRTPPPSLLEPERKAETLTLIIANVVGAVLIVMLVLGAANLARSERPASTRSTEPLAPSTNPAADVHDRRSIGALSFEPTWNSAV